MNIGSASNQSGLPAKTIRYYEEIGLLAPARKENGYRDYSQNDLHRLAFLKHARGLGFSIGDCRQLLTLYDDHSRASHDVRTIAVAHLKTIEEKISELRALKATLNRLIEACNGDDRPDCPILEEMAAVDQ